MHHWELLPQANTAIQIVVLTVSAINLATCDAAHLVWLQAEDAARFHGSMSKGSDMGLADPGAYGDFITPAAPEEMVNESYAEYRVNLPSPGEWRVWGRFRYPTASDMSFSIVPIGTKLLADGSQWFGNSGARAAEWHWDGKGRGTAAMPGASSRDVLVTKPGPWTFRIYAREAAGPIELNPRLDAICITNSFRLIPDDTIAEPELKGR